MKQRKKRSKAKVLNGEKTSKQHVRQSDLARTLRAMKAAGIPVGEISIGKDQVTVHAVPGNHDLPRLSGSGYMTMRDACQYGNFGRSRAYELIAAGALTIKKSGRKTLVAKASIDRWLASLPGNHAPKQRRRAKK